MICPNKTSASYKILERYFTEQEIYEIFVGNEYAMPDEIEAHKIVKNRSAVAKPVDLVETEKKFKLRNADGSRKRFLEKNYTNVVNKVRELNSKNPDLNFSVIKVMGEKGDNRVYYSIKVETNSQEQVSLYPKAITESSKSNINVLLDNQNEFIKELGVDQTIQLVNYSYNKVVAALEQGESYDDTLFGIKADLVFKRDTLKTYLDKPFTEAQKVKIQQGIDRYSNAIDNWGKIENLINHELNKTKGLELEEEGLDNEVKGDVYGKESYEIDPKTKVSAKLKILLSGIRKPDPKASQIAKARYVQDKVKEGLSQEAAETSANNLSDYELYTYLPEDDKYATTWFGQHELIDFNTAYKLLLPILAGENENMETIIRKLENEVKTELWLVEVIEKLKRLDKQTSNQFASQMTKHELDMRYVQINSKKVKVGGKTVEYYNTFVRRSNQNEISQLIHEAWETNFIDTNILDSSGDDYVFNKQAVNTLKDQYDALISSTGKVYRMVVGFTINSKEDYEKFKDLPQFKEQVERTKGDNIVPIVKMRGASFIITDEGLVPKPSATLDVQTILDIYNSVGIKLSEQTAKSLSYKRPAEILQPIQYILEHIFENIDGKYYEDNLQPLNQEGVKKLAKLESKYSPLRAFSPDNFRTQGKQIYAYTMKNFLTERAKQLKNNPALISKLRGTAYHGNSVHLQYLDVNSPLYNTEEGKKFRDSFDTIEDFDLQVLKDLQATVKWGDQRFTRVDEISQEVAVLGLFVNSNTKGDNRIARFVMPTFSDKTRTAIVPFVTTKVTYENDTISDDMVNTIYNRIVMPEIKRIAHWTTLTEIELNHKQYKDGGRFFYSLPELNELNVNGSNLFNIIKSKVEMLGDDFKDMETFGLGEDVEAVIKDYVKSYVNNSILEKLAKWKSYEMVTEKEVQFDLNYLKTLINTTSDTLSQEQLDKALKLLAADFKVNDMLAKAEMHYMFIGDPAMMYKGDRDSDTVVNAIENNQPVNTWSVIYETYTNIGKRLALEIATGKKPANNESEVYIQLMMEDPQLASSTMGYLASVLDGKEFNHDSYTKMSKDEKKAFIKGFENSGDFLKIDGADAQEFTTMKEWLHTMIQFGDTNLTDKEVAELLEIESKPNPTLTEIQRLRDTIISVSKQPQKPVYSGQIYDATLNAMNIVYVKSSAFPLSRHLTKDFQIDNLRILMENLEAREGKFVRASFESANKLGSVNRPLKVFNDNGDVRSPEEMMADINNPLGLPIEGVTEEIARAYAPYRELDRFNFRIQQENPVKEKGYIKRGTQETKLLWLNILGEPGMRDLYEEYLENYRQLYDEGRTDLFKELGLDLDVPLTDQKINLNKLSALLKKEAKERNYPLQDLKGLDIVGNNFVMPLMFHASSNRYESLLNSVINNRILAVKMPGSSYILGTAEGFRVKEVETYGIPEGTIFTSAWTGELTNAHFIDKSTGKPITKKIEQYNPDNIEFVPAKVLAPSKFTIDGKIVKVRDLAIEKNGRLYLDETKIDKSILQLFGFRIPTSGQMSMASIEIAGFLPEDVGDLIIAPRDFTKQMGSDFDVDKLMTYHYELEMVEGKLVRKDSKKNRIIEIHHKVLSSKSSKIQEQILKPLSFDVAKDQAKLIQTQSGKKWSMLDDEYQKMKRVGGSSGKSGCLGYGTKVLMYDGTFKEVQDIVVGDQLMGIDSTPRNVLELCRGTEQMYWVRQNRGMSYRVNESHVLSLKYRPKTLYKKWKIKGIEYKDYSTIISKKKPYTLNIKLNEYIEKSKTFQKSCLGYKTGLINFQEKNINLDPYFVGLWLGDGSKRECYKIHNLDNEVINYLDTNYKIRYCEGLNDVTKIIDKSKIIDGFKKDFNTTTKGILEKFIPDNYLYNTTNVRLNLLAGLIDSDGQYCKLNKQYRITTKDFKLANQIAFLTRSLGFYSSVTKINGKEKVFPNGKLYTYADYYIINFIPELEIPVLISRKKSIEKSVFKNRLYTGIKIEKDVVDNYYGFVLDEDHLFILEDFTVTHNTGWYSLAVTFHATMQQLPVPVQVMTVVDEEKVPYNLTIAGLTSDGRLGREKTLGGGKRYISEVHIQRQNYSVDNEKEQLMFPLNDNNFTFHFNTFMDELGFDLVKVNGVEISLTDFIRTQPVIQEYVALRNLDKSEEEAYDTLLQKYDSVQWQDIVSKPQFAEELLNGTANQAAVLGLFMEASSFGDSMAKVMVAYNTDSGGLGKSIFDNLDKLDKIAEIEQEGRFVGIRQIRNNTINGLATTYGLDTTRVLNDLFPYDKFKPIFERLAEAIGAELTVEDKQDTVKEFRKFIFASHLIQQLEENYDIETLRNELFFQTDTTTSLAKYVRDLKQNRQLNSSLFSLMSTEVNENSLPSTIKWNNSVREDNENKYYFDWLSMFLDESSLPPYNGREMSYQSLAQILVTYAYLEGGIQEATQFIKHVPIEYLKGVGFDKSLRDINFNDPTTFGYDEAFLRQFIQHNPMKVKFKYTPDEIFKAIDGNSKDINKLTSFTLKEDYKPEFIRVYNNKTDIQNRKIRKKGAVLLFMRMDDGKYYKIPVLGIHGMNEYNFDKKGAIKSLVDSYNKNTVFDTAFTDKITASQPTGELFEKGATLESLLTKVTKSNNPYYAKLAKFYLDNLGNLDITLVFKSKKSGDAVPGKGWYDNFTKEIGFDRDIIRKLLLEGNLKDVEKLILHEFTHAFTIKYLDANIIPEALAPHILKLQRLFKIVERQYPNIEAFRENFKKTKLATLEETEDIYGGYNILEFVSLIMTEPKFQEKMSKIPSGETTLWDRIANAFADLIRELLDFAGFNKDSITTEAMASIVNLVTYKPETAPPIEELPDAYWDSMAEEEDSTLDIEVSSVNDIYSQLGNKTQSENVFIDNVNGRKPAVESNINLTKKNLFTVKPIQSVDKKAIVKASIATQYIGFGEGIAGSSTESYRQQILGQSNLIDFQEEQSSGYIERTRKNASADATIDFGLNQLGEPWTKKAVDNNKKKYIGINTNNLTITSEMVAEIVEGLNSVNAKTLNIAGMGIYNMKNNTQEQVDEFVYNLLKQVIESPTLKIKIQSIRTGGQTGFDEAGAKAAQKLGIKTIVLAPKGYIFRNKEGKDIANKQEFENRFNQSSIVNSGNYSSNDVIFVSIGGKRGNETTRKQQQDKTIKEALKAIEAGATLITDNKSYVESSDYNEGEKRLAKNLEAKGYNYSEQTIDGQILGVWSKNQFSKPIVAGRKPAVESNTLLGEILKPLANPKYYNDNIDIFVRDFNSKSLKEFRDLVKKGIEIGHFSYSFQEIENNPELLRQSSKPIVAYRTRGNNFLEALEKDNAIGNPWSHLGSGQNNVKITSVNYTQNTPKENINTAYVFTENINSLGKSRVGGGSAIIRNNPNAIGIVTKKYYVYQEDRATSNIKGGWNQDFQDTNEDFELFKKVNLEQFAKLDKYNSIVFPQGFASDKAKIPTRFALWLQKELQDRYGLVTELNETKTGLISKSVENKNQYGLYKTNTVKEAVEEFIAWMIGEKHTDKLQDYRQAIINKIPELKGKQILYYKDLGRPSHATALDYLINKYDWGTKVAPKVVENKTGSGQIKNNPFKNSKIRQKVYHVDKRQGLNEKTLVDDLSMVFPSGVFFTDNLEYAQNYAKAINGLIYEAFVNVEQPYNTFNKQEIERLGRNPDELKKGHDSIIYKSNDEKADKYGKVGTEIVVYKPEQIKLITKDNENQYGLYKTNTVKEEAEVVSEETPVVETKFRFNDGTEIDVPFTLNSEQRAALLELETFVSNPAKYDNQITLLGYAGTGKTTIISLFDKYLKKAKRYIQPIYTAPTHRANAVTKLNNPNAHVMTLHKMFGLSGLIELENDDYTIENLKFAKQNPPKVQQGDYIIVDESSMVNDALYEFIEDFKRTKDIKVIYVGDPGQLAAINNDGTNVLSKVFTKGTQVQLVKVERTGDNPILEESTNLRNNKPLLYKTQIKNGKGVEYIADVTRQRQVMFEEFTQMFNTGNMLHFRVLSAKNNKIQEVNTSVRQMLFGDAASQQVIVGDLLMGYDNFAVDYNTGEPLTHNSGDYKVVKVTKGTRMVNFDSQNVDFSGYDVTLQNVLNPEDTLKNVFIVDNNESKEKIERYINSIAERNKEGARYMKAGNRKEAANMFAAARGLEAKLAFMQPIVDASGKVKRKKTFDYGYAHTIHKSQGGTYNKTMVLGDTISAPFSTKVQKQLEYVAMSRAKDMVYWVTAKSSGTEIPEYDTDMTSGLNDDFSKWDKVVELSPAGLPQIVVDLRKQSKCQ